MGGQMVSGPGRQRQRERWGTREDRPAERAERGTAQTCAWGQGRHWGGVGWGGLSRAPGHPGDFQKKWGSAAAPCSRSCCSRRGGGRRGALSPLLPRPPASGAGGGKRGWAGAAPPPPGPARLCCLLGWVAKEMGSQARPHPRELFPGRESLQSTGSFIIPPWLHPQPRDPQAHVLRPLT